MENVKTISKTIPKDFKRMIEQKIEEKRNFARRVKAGELDYLKTNVIRTI